MNAKEKDLIQAFFFTQYDMILNDNMTREPMSSEHLINTGAIFMLRRYYESFKDFFTEEQRQRVAYMYKTMDKIYDQPTKP